MSVHGIYSTAEIHLTPLQLCVFRLTASPLDTAKSTVLNDVQRHMWFDEVVLWGEFQETAGVFFSLPTSVYG